MDYNMNQMLGMTLAIALIAGGISGLITANMVSPDGSQDNGDQVEPNQFTLIAYITGFVGEGGDIDGVKNPTLDVDPGARVTIFIKAGEAVTHDLKIDEFNVQSETVAKDSTDYPSIANVTFTAEAGEFTYYCSIPGHSSTMSGKINGGPVDTLDPAKSVDVNSIARDPTDAGVPIGTRNTPMDIEFTIVSEEVVAEIEPGTTFTYWTYNETVPGPVIRAMVGDNITIHLQNAATSTQEHSIDLHAVTGTGGGAATLRSDPGETTSFSFIANHEGTFIYHCASPHIPTHISKGMFGAVIIEPEGGLPAVDVELFLGQNEVYTTHPMGTEGHQEFDDDAQREENPSYVLINGAAFYLTGDNAINITKDSSVRIFFAVGGPNLISSFHMIGEVFDEVWYETSYTSGPNMVSAETVLVAPGSVLMAELTMEELGTYLIVDHALSRVFDKGALAQINVVSP